MDGILLIDKPVGITSYDVIRKLKRTLNTNKIGHVGTLDPFASGLLVILIGKATKLSNLFIGDHKTYDGTLVFGNHYDTYDVTGNIVKSNDIVVNLSMLESIYKDFIGEYYQKPPIYSAIKVQGKKLYEYARNNQTVEIKKRLVNITSLKFNETNEKNTFKFETAVSSGTYIRSLAVDISSKLNTYGALKTLRRNSSGIFNLSDAHKLDEVTVDNIISIEEIFRKNEKIVLNDYLIRLVKNGIYLDERQIKTEDIFLVYNDKNELIALYEPVSHYQYKPLIIF